MQDMRDLYKAYSAVHDTTIKEELDNSKDQITEMNLSQLTEGDLVELAEEIIEGLFQYGLDLDEAYGVVGDILEEASGNIIGGRKDKIVRIAESFEKAFDTVTDKAERNCEEAFLLYRKNKPLTEKWNNRVSHETGNAKIHASIIHEDRQGIKLGLIEMLSDVIEGMHRDAKTGEVVDKAEVGKTYYPNQPKKKTSVTKKPDAFGGRFKKEEVSTLRQGWGDAYSSIYEKKLDPVGQEDGDIDNDGDEDSSDKYLAKRRKAIGKAMKKEEVENVDERYVGKHGQVDKEYARSRSNAGKMISGDDKMSGAEYTHGRRVKVANPGMQPDVGGKTKPKSQGKMDKGSRADLQFRKAALKKEEVTFSEAELKAFEQIVNSWED